MNGLCWMASLKSAGNYLGGHTKIYSHCFYFNPTDRRRASDSDALLYYYITLILNMNHP